MNNPQKYQKYRVPSVRKRYPLPFVWIWGRGSHFSTKGTRYLFDVYADIISNFDLAMADCDRYLSAESAVQDLNFISSHDGPPGTNSRSRRTAMEMATIAPSCLKINTTKASGTPESRALLYLSQTKLIK